MCPKSTRLTVLIAIILLLVLPVLGAVPPGRITVYSTPSNAMACIDNRNCDLTPATFSVEGNAWHMIVIKEAGYHDWIDTIYVTSDMTSTANAYLDQDPAVTAIRVNVSPGGGTICLDNMQCRAGVGTIGSNGSTVFTGVSAGYHTISVESPAGYQDAMQLVQVKLGNTTDVSITLATFVPTPTPTLTQVPATGMVRVYVDRTGSTVCLDNARCVYNLGGEFGQGTGTMVFDRVTANETHIVTVAADGFEPFSTAVTVGKDLITTVEVRLQPIAGIYTTTVTTAAQTSFTTAPLTSATPLPTMPTNRSGLDAVPVLGALFLCGIIVLFRKGRQ